MSHGGGPRYVYTQHTHTHTRIRAHTRALYNTRGARQFFRFRAMRFVPRRPCTTLAQFRARPRPPTVRAVRPVRVVRWPALATAARHGGAAETSISHTHTLGPGGPVVFYYLYNIVTPLYPTPPADRRYARRFGPPTGGPLLLRGTGVFVFFLCLQHRQ